MEFTVSYASFITAVSDINKIISSKSVIPILSGMKIEANENGLKLTGSNSDISIERIIPLRIDGVKVVEIKEFGSVVVLSNYLNEIVKKLPSDICVKSGRNDSIIIESGDIETKLTGFNANDFPKLPEMDCNNNVKIPFGKLAEAIRKTAFAVSKSEAKPVLTGVKMEFEGNKLVCTATDSHRLARHELPIESEMIESFVVPSTSLSELTHLKVADSSIVDISYKNNFIVFGTADSKLYSRLIEGIYPNTRSLVPTESKVKITMNTQTLIEGIDRACVFATEWKHNNVQLEIIDEATIKISSNSTEIGMIEEFQKIIQIEGQNNIQMSFDGRFVLDALKRIQEENVTIRFDGLMKPIVIQPLNDSTCLHLISPVRSY